MLFNLILKNCDEPNIIDGTIDEIVSGVAIAIDDEYQENAFMMVGTEKLITAAFFSEIREWITEVGGTKVLKDLRALLEEHSQSK